MKSTLRKISQIKRQWHQIDASKYRLGRLSTIVARILMGKHRVDYTPNVDMGDFVVVVNSENIQFTGKKIEQKKYYRYTGYHGGIRIRNLSDLLKTRPEFVIRESVRRMLPKNKIRKFRLRRLKLLKGPKNNFKVDHIIN